jgi:hypothetical protein
MQHVLGGAAATTQPGIHHYMQLVEAAEAASPHVPTLTSMTLVHRRQAVLSVNEHN